MCENGNSFRTAPRVTNNQNIYLDMGTGGRWAGDILFDHLNSFDIHSTIRAPISESFLAFVPTLMR